VVDSSWTRAIDAILRGEAKHYRGVRLGPVPPILRQFGLAPADLTMSAAKIAKARREHPEVSLQIWYDLPALLDDPEAIFPSTRADGTVVVVIAVRDADGNPVIVPIVPDRSGQTNTVLSVYGKSGDGVLWIARQIASAQRQGLAVYERSGSADSEPKPESADAISWSPDPISVDRSTEPKRPLLKLREKSTKS
jgi:hypothetical protein